MWLALRGGMQDDAPGLSGIHFLKTSCEREPALLTDLQRKELVRIGTRLRLPAHATVYREGTSADAVFVIVDGAVKSYREGTRGKRVVSAFLFRHDLFGLAERGRYVNSVQAITRVTLYRLALGDLLPLVKRDAEFQFKFLVKITHELRASQRRAIVISRPDAIGRLAMFLQMMREHPHAGAGNPCEIPLPMNRTDIADFLGLSRGTVSRAANKLQRQGVVRFEGRHLARVVDRILLAKVAAGQPPP